MDILRQGIDGVAGTHLTSQGELLVVDISSHDSSATLDRTNNGSHTYHATADDEYHVDIRHLCTADSVEAYTHGFDQRAGTGREQSGRDDFLPRQHEVFAHGAPALDT